MRNVNMEMVRGKRGVGDVVLEEDTGLATARAAWINTGWSRGNKHGASVFCGERVGAHSGTHNRVFGECEISVCPSR